MESSILKKKNILLYSYCKDDLKKNILHKNRSYFKHSNIFVAILYITGTTTLFPACLYN